MQTLVETLSVGLGLTFCMALKRLGLRAQRPYYRLHFCRLSDLVVEVVDVDGIDVEAFVSECRCGGSFVLTLDTVTETKRSVDKWNVECDTCSLLMTVVNN